MLGEGFRVIAPSRFGYFGSTLPPHATPADQAEVYALLLEHLGIDRAAVLAYSAGSASALELALRHPDRVVGLILANARLGGPTPNKRLEPIQSTVYGWERLWWLYRRLLPGTYGRMVGVPKGYQPTPRTSRPSVRSASCSSRSSRGSRARSSTGSCPTWSPTGSASRS